MKHTSWRWLAIAVFVMASTLNYLDRSLLNVLAPLILKEFHLNQLSFGYVISVFSIVYAISSLAAGVLLDRFGLNRSISAAVAWWSTASILTAATKGLGGLIAVRAGLAVGESAGVPAFGKANGTYLKPSEYALGAAVNQVGLSLGPIVAARALPLALIWGWRLPFAICGVLGLAWIPAWWWTSRTIVPQNGKGSSRNFQHVTAADSMALWKVRELWVLIAANVLWMGGYSLWSNWVTLYLTHVQQVPLAQVARYVWIPPVASTFGGFFGGWLSLRWINGGASPLNARRRAVWVSAIGGLVTLLLPLTRTPVQATAVISVSFFFLLAGSVNIYALPIDIFGAEHAGMAIAALTLAFGLLQTVISPIIGWLADRQLYSAVVWMVTVPLLLSAWVLIWCRQGKIRTEASWAQSNQAGGLSKP